MLPQHSKAEFAKVESQFTDLLNSIRSAAAGGNASTHRMQQKVPVQSTVDPAIKGEQFKAQGNAYYKEGEYQEAIRYYTQALALCPENGSYYGNRAAAWSMLKEYKRAIDDCKEGIRHEDKATPGAMDKVRIRLANAYAASGQIPQALELLQQSMQDIVNRYEADDNEEEEDEEAAAAAAVAAMKPFKDAVSKIEANQTQLDLAQTSLDNKEYSRAKRLFNLCMENGLTDHPQASLGLAKSYIALNEFENGSREAQKVIAMGLGSVSIEAYVVRADALLGMGCSELAKKHLTVALQMDPDNKVIQMRLKTLKRIVSETQRVRELVDAAMNARKFEEAITLCAGKINEFDLILMNE